MASASAQSSQRTWDIVVVGGANWDYLAHGQQLPKPGGTVRGHAFQEDPGGKGANQAVAAARLGARVAAVVRLGADARGDAIVQALERERISVERVVRDHESPTGIAVIQVGGDGEKQILTAPGANERLSVDDVHAARSLLEDTRVLLVQLEVPLEVVETSVRIAHAAGALVVLDPAPPVKVSPDLLRLVYLIRSNSDEARVLTDVPVRERRTARRAATLLLESGVRAAVVQAGAEGNLMLWSEDGTTREQWLPHFQVNTVDTTGAGDAFAAALAVEIALGRPLDEAGRFASATAALTTTKFGAQPALPTRADVESFLARLGS